MHSMNKHLMATFLSAVMLALATCYSYAQDQEVDLRYLIEKEAPIGFADVRGKQLPSYPENWHSHVYLTGSDGCYVDWEKGPSHRTASLDCLMLTTRDESEARKLYLRLIDLAVGVEPKWSQVYEPPSHKDNQRSIVELGNKMNPDLDVNRSVDVSYDKLKSGEYRVRVIVWSGLDGEQAEEEVQERARAEASVKQNVCISDELTQEWRNPPAGGKMESVKRLLVQSFRERAKTYGYDQTKWAVVDSRSYAAWPNTSWGSLVSMIPGGSCPAGHRETLTLAH